MSPEQAEFLLFKAAAAYPNQIELEEETVALWIERLANVPFEWGLSNLNYHLDRDKYFPGISDIIRADLIPVQNQNALRLEAANHKTNLERWAAADAPPPEGFWEEIKAKLRGGSGE
ncbi:hypothetical protein KP806_07370 [Paenibacillus sp. N4]|uniref:hypothetical protein n=1 Tax=Paenibacillus vietnamensis TaxID=2590547 RepID=UPI001CD12468|nr:hypothetical protein [Paenibacillus vietnamensis]MCA0754865.1 hypothetical protein [Paenibacillus vietnamensis]